VTSLQWIHNPRQPSSIGAGYPGKQLSHPPGGI